MRRIASRTIADYWREVFAEPLGLDIWIGLPAEENARVATIYPARASSATPPDAFYRALAKPGTLQRKAFTSPRGLHAVSAMNTAENRARAFVSFGGIGSAASLAKFYAMLSNGGELRRKALLLAAHDRADDNNLTAGIDRVFEIPTAFSAGFMKDPPDAEQADLRSFARRFRPTGSGRQPRVRRS